MKNQLKGTKSFLILLVVHLLIFGCINNEKNKNTVSGNKDSAYEGNSPTQLIQDSATRDSSEENVVHEKTLTPYKQVDSLKKAINHRYNLRDVKMLDKICSNSDGDLAESFEEVSKQLFENNIDDFIDYLLVHPNSCLKRNLIYGLGADLFVYEKAERSSKLIETQERLILKAKKEGLSDKKIQFIKELFKKVNPDLLD